MMGDVEEPTPAIRPRAVLLSGYAAKSCARVIHNEYDVTVPEVAWEPPADLRRLFDLGNAFEADVLARWAALGLDGYVDLRRLDGDKHRHIDATVEAMRAGAPVIVGGRLPDDPAGCRTGKPDILLREASGRGYHPADVKAHHVLDPRRTAGTVSTLRAPAHAQAYTMDSEGVRYRERDLIQLAHYWRMLEACDMRAGHPWGAILGDDRPDEPLLAWFDLTEPRFRTFSRTHGAADRSALERYDHEHDFRVRVARRAQERRGGDDDPEPLVAPIGHDECRTCRWAPVCVDTLPATDASRELRGKLGVREYLALREHGVRTVDDLAVIDTVALLAGEYGVETAHLGNRAERLRRAVIAAQLARDGAVLRVKPDTVIDIPTADVEVDLDIEWSRADHVYFWGLLVTDAGGSRYVSFFDPGIDTAEAEAALARRCLVWLHDLAARTAADGRSMLVYHYWIPEPTKAREFLPLPEDASHPDRWVDLLPFVRAAVDSRYGHGLKLVAQNGPGHSWRDPDPGGLQSQDWLEVARHGAPEERQQARARLLAYNEDDVRATLAVRTWLRDMVSRQPSVPHRP
jgi:predicted RecB family nuclease